MLKFNIVQGQLNDRGNYGTVICLLTGTSELISFCRSSPHSRESSHD